MKLPNQVSSAAEFGLLRAFLAQNGFSQSWITKQIGTNVSGRTRAEITMLLRAGLKTLPKKV